VNTDQGVQFTSTDFLAGPEAQAVRISMDGKGRYLDNIFIERLWRSLNRLRKKGRTTRRTEIFLRH
jgi:putative transposase